LENYSQAAEDFSKAVVIDSTDVIDQTNLGDALNQAKKYQEAETVLIKATEVDATYSRPWNLLGIVHENLNNYKSAAICFERAAKINPENVTYQTNLCNAYIRLKKFDLAIFSFNKAIKIDPRNAVTWNLLGHIYYNGLYNADSALQFYTIAENLDSTDGSNLNNIANALSDKGDYDSALSVYEKAKILSPKDNVIFGNIARLYLFFKKYKKAILYSDTSLAIDSTHSRPYAYKGFAQLKFNNNEGLNLLYKAISIDPGDYKPYFYLAAYYSHENKQPLALKELDTAIAKGFMNPPDLETEEWFKNLENNNDYAQLKKSLKIRLRDRRISLQKLIKVPDQ
jgi:tetratricopeptide (TPR) repeat protein